MFSTEKNTTEENTPEENTPDPLIAKLNKRIKRFEDDRKDALREVAKLRKYYRGKQTGDDGEVRVNLIYSTLASIIPQIYAKNPEVSVQPKKSVSPSQYELYGKFAETLEVVLNNALEKDAKIKKKGRAALRSAMATGVGWVKMQYQRSYGKDPVIQSRLQDIQDNIAALRRARLELEDASGTEQDALIQEMEVQMQALQSQPEIVVAEGLVLDRVPMEDLLFLDDGLIDFDDYPDAQEIAQRIWMPATRFTELFGKKVPDGATRYASRDKEDGSTHTKAGDTAELVCVYEIWSKTTNSVFTLIEGCTSEWAREPYQPDFRTRRFNPFYGLAYNLVDGYFDPVSDVEYLMDLQDEYNAMRTQQMDARKENKPVWLFRMNGNLTEDDMERIVNRGSRQFVGVQGNPSQPLAEDIANFPPQPVNPVIYDASPILRDIEMLTGASDASRGFINKAKTATEAEIMSMGLQSRSAERQDAIDEWLTDIANGAAELLLQAMTTAQAQALAGEDAVWPEMNRQQVFEFVNVSIRAGSTGKPNKNQERDQWIQMLPQIQQGIAQIMQARAQGQHEVAQTGIKLIEETLRRFDERLDINEFIPQQLTQPQPGAMAGLPGQIPGAPMTGAAQ